MFSDPAFWVAISFLGFIALLFYFKVPALAAKGLDDRADKIRDELEEARKLREDAQAILADYQRKQREAEQSAEDIVTQAKKEAEAYAQETRQALAESLERRTKLAEEKIERAETQAVNEIKSISIQAAVAAAEQLITKNLDENKAKGLIETSIKGLSSKLN